VSKSWAAGEKVGVFSEPSQRLEASPSPSTSTFTLILLHLVSQSTTRAGPNEERTEKKTHLSERNHHEETDRSHDNVSDEKSNRSRSSDGLTCGAGARYKRERSEGGGGEEVVCARRREVGARPARPPRQFLLESQEQICHRDS